MPSAHPRVPGYRLESVLGRGRRSVVYLARGAGASRVAAVKLTRLSPRGFQPEFDTMAALASTGTVRALAHGSAGGHAFLAMEHMAGGDLRALCGRISNERVFDLMVQAAQALARLHEQGWVHRDLKPANLLLRADGSLALGDLGCACRIGQAAGTAGELVGTPQYAAPEQSQGAAAQPAADVYSLGAVLHELLCGAPAYPGPGLAEIISQHLAAPLPRLPSPHASWQVLLDRLLAKDPAQRPADGRAALAQLHSHRKSS